MKLTKLFTLLLFVLLLSVVAQAQNLYGVSGGTRSEANPKDKNKPILIGENESIRVSFLRSEKFMIKKPVIFLWLKVENLSDKPLTITPSKFSAVDDSGEAFSGLDPKDAIQMILDSHAGSQYAISTALAGPLSGPAASRAAERKVTQEWMSQSLQPGDIPPHSFKEGMIFIQAPPKKEKAETTLKVSLSDLWPAPFIFSTTKPK